ncbi:putative toxin-antitoxin system toxin component, PIN family [Acidobacteria bacterium AH-259-L09]|nr:putative toxin-antitoxin system toxin component, PIN family [Acidobacteria bacterium AH-259-L09]
MKVVLDTNTLVSAIGWEGPPARILRACRARRFSLLTSPQLLEELTRVLTNLKLRMIAQHPDLAQILEWLHAPARLVYPRRAIQVITVDPSDNRDLEVAIEGRVEAVISGDEHLLGLRVFEGIPILTAAAFCRRWDRWVGRGEAESF